MPSDEYDLRSVMRQVLNVLAESKLRYQSVGITVVMDPSQVDELAKVYPSRRAGVVNFSENRDWSLTLIAAPDPNNPPTGATLKPATFRKKAGTQDSSSHPNQAERKPSQRKTRRASSRKGG